MEAEVQSCMPRAWPLLSRALRTAGTSALSSLAGVLLLPCTSEGVSAGPKDAGWWYHNAQTPFCLCQGPGDRLVLTFHAARLTGGPANLPVLAFSRKFSPVKQWLQGGMRPSWLREGPHAQSCRHSAHTSAVLGDPWAAEATAASHPLVWSGGAGQTPHRAQGAAPGVQGWSGQPGWG